MASPQEQQPPSNPPAETKFQRLLRQASEKKALQQQQAPLVVEPVVSIKPSESLGKQAEIPASQETKFQRLLRQAKEKKSQGIPAEQPAPSQAPAEKEIDPRDQLPWQQVLSEAIADSAVNKRLSEKHVWLDRGKSILDEIMKTRDAVTSDPNDLESWYHLGALSRDNIKDAYVTDRIFQEVIKLHPKDTNARRYRVRDLDILGQRDKAIAVAEEAISEGVIDSNSLDRFADIISKIDEPAEKVKKMDAINKAFEKLLSAESDPEKYIHIAISYAITLQRVEGNTVKAIEISEKLVQDPKYKHDPEVWMQYDFLLSDARRRDEIPSMLRRAVVEGVRIDDHFVYHYAYMKDISSEEARKEIQQIQAQAEKAEPAKQEVRQSETAITNRQGDEEDADILPWMRRRALRERPVEVKIIPAESKKKKFPRLFKKKEPFRIVDIKIGGKSTEAEWFQPIDTKGRIKNGEFYFEDFNDQEDLSGNIDIPKGTRLQIILPNTAVIHITGGKDANLPKTTMQAIHSVGGTIIFNTGDYEDWEKDSNDFSKDEGGITIANLSVFSQPQERLTRNIPREDALRFMTEFYEKKMSETEERKKAPSDEITAIKKGDLLKGVREALKANEGKDVVRLGVAPEQLAGLIKKVEWLDVPGWKRGFFGMNSRAQVEIQNSNALSLIGESTKLSDPGNRLVFMLGFNVKNGYLELGPNPYVRKYPRNINTSSQGFLRNPIDALENNLESTPTKLDRAMRQTIETYLQKKGIKNRQVSGIDIKDGQIIFDFEKRHIPPADTIEVTKQPSAQTETLEFTAARAEPEKNLSWSEALDEALTDPDVKQRLSQERDWKSQDKTILERIVELRGNIERDSSDIESWRELAYLADDSLRNIEVADKIYQEIIRLHPDDINSRSFYFFALKNSGQVDRALAVAEESIDKGVVNALSLWDFADTFSETGQPAEKAGRMDKVNKAYEKLISALAEGDPSTYVNCVSFYAHTLGKLEGKIEQAIKVYENLVKNPKVKQHEDAWIQYYGFLSSIGRENETLNILERAVREGVEVGNKLVFIYAGEKKISADQARVEMQKIQSEAEKK